MNDYTDDEIDSFIDDYRMSVEEYIDGAEQFYFNNNNNDADDPFVKYCDNKILNIYSK